MEGSSGCNRYTGYVTLGETALIFGSMAGTRMMCSDSQVMTQESPYLGRESWNLWRWKDSRTRDDFITIEWCGKEGGSQTALLVS